ncbi:unnamed protein product [marine sediment metagenome]|uniref:SAP domain-containing protein n=1 Tax=marine sediment metagenome TaxID=412755 RepID=X1QIG2_9ZZZZ
MPAEVRLSKKELEALIGKIERGEDAIELKRLLAEVEEEKPPRKPARPRVPPPGILAEELTTQERLEAEVGYLFPEGITDKILAECIEMDGKYTLVELRKMCIEAGLSPSGHKKELAAKLIARGVK